MIVINVAIKSENGYLCRNCCNKCKISELSKIGKKTNFEVYIFFHRSDFKDLKLNLYEDKGVIGVACVLNLIEGGLKLRELKANPQCLLLNYCGCSRHWSKYGLITKFNINKLFNMLEIN